MTRAEQRVLVLELGMRVLQEIVEKIQQGEQNEDAGIPANWDGHQLREYLSVKFARERTDKMLRSSRTLGRQFRNDLLVRNL